ncbi:hypothetical protein LZ24_01782 [Desulfobotulus alkaliphilus]|uniref:Uncharacterized protein n=1 Tax=Desulfobotulus alkaliphilus TaxID=622671 RepID=A0A562RTW6_9BACT|nr:hypothetical protein [Desulfobotulus alkaliphilus]TWI71766.1 hypothetical protein LZ24_01782 [Desulfobotulus alkaliphilus]
MDSVVWGIIVGFFLGSFGYILIRFIISPVFQYRKLKKKIAEDLKIIERSSRKDRLNRADLKRADGLRLHAKALIHQMELVLPLWFRLSLERQNENPLEAASEMMTLSGIRTPEHMEKRIETVRRHLRLQSD